MGIGQRLMQFALEQAMRLNLKSIYLRVHRGNDRALRLYEKSGFDLEREDADVRIMRRKLER